MQRLLFLAVIILAFSCAAKTDKISDNIQVVKKYDYLIKVTIWNGLFGLDSKFILNNLGTETFDSSDFNNAKPFTLYFISNSKKVDLKHPNNLKLVPSDTTEIQFSNQQSDTLFYLTNEFFKNVNFSNYDTIGKKKALLRDDSHARIELDDGDKRLSATISSISNPAISSKQLDTLINFIWKFKPPTKE